MKDIEDDSEKIRGLTRRKKENISERTNSKSTKKKSYETW